MKNYSKSEQIVERLILPIPLSLASRLINIDNKRPLNHLIKSIVLEKKNPVDLPKYDEEEFEIVEAPDSPEEGPSRKIILPDPLPIEPVILVFFDADNATVNWIVGQAQLEDICIYDFLIGILSEWVQNRTPAFQS